MATSTIFANIDIRDSKAAQKIAEALNQEPVKVSEAAKNSSVYNDEEIKSLTEEVLKEYV